MSHPRHQLLGAFVAAALAASAGASCTNGTNYDGSYTGGYSVGDGGTVAYSIPTGAAGPQVARTADGAFGVYFSEGSFTSPATVTISPASASNGGGYGVTITGATPTKPFVVFFGNNGGEGQLTDDKGPLGVQVQANGVSFGLVSSSETSSVYSRTNQMPTGSTGGHSQTLPACLQNCQLGSSGGSTFDYCYANTTTGDNGNTEKLFDCVIGCGEPAPLASTCKSNASASGVAVQCGPNQKCSGSSPFCCEPMGSATSQACSSNPTCAPGNYAFGCDGPEDCSQGQVCCLDTTGTHCGPCDVSHQVCHQGAASQCNAGTCTPVSDCGPTPFAIATCGILPQCPIAGGSTTTMRNVPCPGGTGSMFCKSTEQCIVPKGGVTPPLCGQSCNTNTSYCFECLGHLDCAGMSSLVCCAYGGGTRCQPSCAPEAQVCTSDGSAACPGMTGCPASPIVCQPTDYPNAPQLLFCNPPSTCPVTK